MTEDKKIRTIFMGTPEFAVPCFLSLKNDSDFKILAVVTQADKKIGRKQILTPPPVKAAAELIGLPVWQPEKIGQIKEELAGLEPDLIVVVAYGQIIPQTILDIPKHGCVNVHGSLLPTYRGAACLQAPVLNGDEKTGITIMKMDAGLDTGPILKQTEIRMTPDETLQTLHDKLSTLGAEILPQALKDYLNEKIKPQAQDDSKASYVKQIKKQDGCIDWQKTAQEIERQIRAFNPWPGTFMEKDGLIIKILEVENQIFKTSQGEPGEFFLQQEKLILRCGQNALIVKKIQPAGKKPMTAADFVRGHGHLIGKSI